MPKYNRKPLVVEARLWDGNNHRAMFDFLTGTKDMPISSYGDNFDIDHHKVNGGLVIRGSGRESCARIGDYIVKGINGEFYPVEGDVFPLLYDLIEEEAKDA